MFCLKKSIRLQIEKLVREGMTEEEAKNSAPLMKETREMLLKWEAGDKEVIELWKMMNSWVYAGLMKLIRNWVLILIRSIMNQIHIKLEKILFFLL